MADCSYYHLAQINIARMLAPLDSPVMQGFVEQLGPVNAQADQSSGFVWRLQTSSGDATEVRAFDDPLILVNMSVWESVDALRDFAYRSCHSAPLRDRLRWFGRPPKTDLVLWWIPAGHIPTVEEAKARLEYRVANGDTPATFSFAKAFPRPEPPQPSSTIDASGLSYDGKRFSIVSGPETVFHYRQHGSRVWALYKGGGARFGALVACTDAHGNLDARYQHVEGEETWRTGRCASRPELLPDGRVRLHQSWESTSEPRQRGCTVIEEVPTSSPSTDMKH